MTPSSDAPQLNRRAALRELRELAREGDDEAATVTAALDTHLDAPARLCILADLMAPEAAPHITSASQSRHSDVAAVARAAHE